MSFESVLVAQRLRWKVLAPRNFSALLHWAICKRCLLEDDPVRQELQAHSPAMNLPVFTEWFKTRIAFSLPTTFHRLIKSPKSKSMAVSRLIEACHSWYTEMLAPNSERLFRVDRCPAGTYNGGLGVFLERDYLMPGAATSVTSKTAVLQDSMSGDLLFVNATERTALVRQGHPSMVVAGGKDGVLIGFLSLVNHVCSSNENCLCLWPEPYHGPAKHRSRLRVYLLRVGGSDRVLPQGAQLLVTYEGRNHYLSPFQNSCGCEVCSGNGTSIREDSDVPAEVEDDTIDLDYQPSTPAKRRRKTS
jgi:hypothetical protein